MVAKEYATADEEIMERLQEHYDNGVLPVEPDQKFEELKKRYIENPEGFGKLAAEGLDKTYWTTDEIIESDLEGSHIEFHPNMPVTVMAIPEKMAPRLMKKLGFEGFRGLAFTKYDFKKKSPFYETNVILMTNDEDFETGKKHEKSHVLYRELSRPRNDAYSISCATEGEKHREAQSLMIELDLLSELLAYGISDWDKDENYNKKRFSHLPTHPLLDRCPIPPTSENTIRTVLKLIYALPYAPYLADMIDDSGVLPNCGIVSRHKAKNISTKAAANYLEGVVDAGVDTFKILDANLPEDTVKRIITSCGPSKEDVLSGKGYVRPAQELKEWSTHYETVLANAESAYI